MLTREMPQMLLEPPLHSCKERDRPDLCCMEGQAIESGQWPCCLGGGQEATTEGVPIVLVTVVPSWVSSCGKMQHIIDFKHVRFIGYQLSLKKHAFEIGPHSG